MLGRLAPNCRSMQFMTAAFLTIDGIACFVTRSGYTGEDGFEISVPGEAAVAIARELLRDPEVKPVGLGARDSLRLEAGLCLYGNDIDETTTPVEAGLIWAIDKRRREEGGFPGAAIIQTAIRARARRASASASCPKAARRCAPMRRSASGTGEPIGEITSGGFGPTVNAPVAMGYVASRIRRRHAAARRSCAASRWIAPSWPCLSSRIAITAVEGITMSDMRFTEDHEWIRIDGDIATIGITDYAQEQLGDVVFVELPDVGSKVEKGKDMAVVESVKAASEVYAPVSAKRSRHQRADGGPATVNAAAMGDGWFVQDEARQARARQADGRSRLQEIRRGTALMRYLPLTEPTAARCWRRSACPRSTSSIATCRRGSPG